MPVLDASALNDNREELAFLRDILASGTRCGHRSARKGATHAGSFRHSLRLGVPLVVGIPVSITIRTSPIHQA